MRLSAPDTLLWDGLVATGLVTQEQLDVCTRQHRHQIGLGRVSDIAEILQRNLFVTPQAIKSYLREKGISGGTNADAPLLSPSICQRYKVTPVRVVDQALILHSARSLDYTTKLMIMAACPAKPTEIRTVLVDRATMRRELQKLGDHQTFESQVALIMRGDKSTSDLRGAIDALLHECIDRRASDIHLDRKPDPESIVALRVDSTMQQGWILRENVMSAVFSRIKTLGGMDASDSRRAQDGRMQIEHRGRTVSFRVGTQPIVNGEAMSIRIIDAEMLPSPAQLFPHQPHMVQVLTGIANADGKVGGLVLITGPTGSGKSTTLYTMVSAMPRDRRNVITVEDPVEFILPFTRQILVNQLLDQKATDFERSVLRQDPDVLVFGEIRDADSARAALKFAESGHLVLASLHAQSASQAVERLLSIIGEKDRTEAALVIAQTLITVINQQLVQRLCDCSVEFYEEHPYGPLAGALGGPPPKARRKAVGCPKCEGSGYRGRALLHETLIFDLDDEGRHALAVQVSKHGTINGMTNPQHHIISRPSVAFELLGGGIVDDSTVIRSLRGAFSDSPAPEAT